MDPQAPSSPPGPGTPGPSTPPRSFVLLVAILVVSLLANIVLVARTQEAESDRRRAEEALRRAAAPTLNPPATGSPSPSSSLGTGPIDRIARAIERLRGLRFKTGVSPEVLTPEALRKRVDAEFRKEQPVEEIKVTQKVLVALGLIGPGDDLYRILLEVQTEQVAGYYDSDSKKLVVAGSASNLSPYDRVLTAHELTHAVTDQHFDLSRLEELSDARKDDEATAYLSLVEGDATLMMVLYRQQDLTARERQDMDEQASRQSSAKLDAAPAVIRRSLLFPYDQGAVFVAQLYQRGGTAAIDQAYRDPPTSTEQILHPQRYLQRDDPTAVTLPNVASSLGAGWKQIDAGGIGELDVLIVADQFLSEDDAEQAAEGWDGGRYVALESSAGTLVAMHTVWDSDSEAREAADRLAEWLRPRFAGRGSSYRDEGVYGWDSGGGAGEVLRSGTRVTLVVGPDRDSVGRARRAFS